MIKSFLVLLAALLCTSCSSGPSVPDGRILVLNDSMDREYNQIIVSSGGSRKTLSPGEHTILPKGPGKFTVSRHYKDYTRYYSVECPPVKGSGLKIKLIDIHVNRIAGGCQTVDASVN